MTYDIDERADELFYFLLVVMSQSIADQPQVLQRFEEYKAEFRRHIKEILRHAGK